MAKRNWPAAVVGGLILGAAAAVAKRGLARYAIEETSMSPALEPGDYVLARRNSLPFRRGEVVIYAGDARPEFALVKRVVGLPGEHVVIKNAQVHVQGHVLAEPWADGPTLPDGKWALGPSELFVLGDRRAASADDSRTTGPIPFDAVEATVRYRYWPFSRLGKL